MLLHIGQVIKVKGKHRSDSSLKPWEKVMNAIPIDVQCNALIDVNDPGLTYILLLSMDSLSLTENSFLRHSQYAQTF